MGDFAEHFGIEATVPAEDFLAARQTLGEQHPAYLAGAVGGLVDGTGSQNAEGAGLFRALGNQVTTGELSAENAATVSSYLEQLLRAIGARAGLNVEINWGQK